MKPFAVHRQAGDEELTGRVLCHDVRGHRHEIVFRKGHALRVDDIALLRDCPWAELHLLELGPDDLGQREAGQRLAGILSSAGLLGAPAGHRHLLRATHNGLLKIDVPLLQRLNGIAGVAIFTRMNDQVVTADQVVAEAQITPLAIGRRSIDEVAQIVGAGGAVVRLLPFIPREAIVWMRDDRLDRAVTEKLGWFGCPIGDVLALPPDAGSIRLAMERGLESGATLFLVSGSNALDPLDPIFQALEQLGANMQRMGMPVHPGTLLWIASWREITIVGLPSCGLGAQVTAFDLVLPKLLAEGGIRDDELAALGHGGMLIASLRSEQALSPGTARAPMERA